MVNNSQRPVSVAEYNDYVAKAMSEDTLQLRVQELLELHRWRWFHDQDSRRNNAGLPDVVAVKPGRLLFSELKTERGRLRPDQTVWRQLLEDWAERLRCAGAIWDAPQFEYHLWRPSDLLAGRIAEVLK